MEKLKILAVPPNHGGCAYYRIINPMSKLIEMYGDKVEIRFNDNPLELDVSAGGKYPDPKDENCLKDMRWADIIFVHTICKFGGPYTAQVAYQAKVLGKFLHYDTDDLLTDLYEGHRLYGVYKDNNLSDICKYIYNIADLTTVTQKKFADRIKEHCGGVLAIVRNAIDYNLPSWNHKKLVHPRSSFIRVGWVAGIHHEEDIKEFSGVPFLVNSRVGKENVFWNFYGKPTQPKEGEKKDWQHSVWDNYTKILTRGFNGTNNWKTNTALGSHEYGAFYSDMDLSIAPLQMNNFNDSKSEIKVAECGRYKIPLIASDVGCYSELIVNGETGYLLPPTATKSEWAKVLIKCIKDPKHIREMGENLHVKTNEYFDLNKVVNLRLKLYSESFALLKERNKGLSYNTEWELAP